MNLVLSLTHERLARLNSLKLSQFLNMGFDFYKVKAHVQTNSYYLIKHFEIGYRYFIKDIRNAGEINLIVLEKGKPGYEESLKVLFPDRIVTDHILISPQLGWIIFLKNRSLLAYYSVKLLFGQLISRLQDRFVGLHSATLVFRGHGLLLCGSAMCGKTILTALLMEKGFICASDDVTLLKRSSLKVVPFPRALNIRKDSESLAAPLISRARSKRRFKIANEERLLVDLSQDIPSEIKTTVLCFPWCDKTSKPGLFPLNPASVLPMVMHHRFHPLVGLLEDQNAGDFDTLARWLGQLECYQLKYSHPREGADLLFELLSKG